MPIPRNQVKSETIKAESAQVTQICERLDALILAAPDDAKTIWLDVTPISDHVLARVIKKYSGIGWLVEIFSDNRGKAQIQLK